MQEFFKGAWTACKEFFARVFAWLKTHFPKAELPLLFALVTVAGLALRIPLFNIRSGDYNSFLVKWFDAIKANGGFKALGESYGDYTPAYYYILAFLTYLPVNSLYSIKAVSCLFDILLALFTALCVKELTGNKTLSLCAYAAAFLLPTVFLNSAWWAQCDCIFTAFCMASVYFLLRDKKYTAVILYGVAFAFKLQAIFIAPLFAVLWFKRKIPLVSPLLILGVYFVFCIPAWIAGQPLADLLTVYFHQAGEYTRLTLNAPTFAALLGSVRENSWGILSATLVIFTLCLTVLAMYICGRKAEWDKKSYIDFALLFALGVPFFLPRMHERYFYLADLVALVYAFARPKRLYTAVLTAFCSFFAIARFLFGANYLSLEFVALVQFVNLVLLCVALVKDYRRKPISVALEEGENG